MRIVFKIIKVQRILKLNMFPLDKGGESDAEMDGCKITMYQQITSLLGEWAIQDETIQKEIDYRVKQVVIINCVRDFKIQNIHLCKV